MEIPGQGRQMVLGLNIYPVEFVDHSTGTALRSVEGGFNRGALHSALNTTAITMITVMEKRKVQERKSMNLPKFVSIDESPRKK